VPSSVSHFSRYLPSDEQAREWGWRLVNAGRQTIGKRGQYPAPGHPEDYFFDKSGRRVLDEFQVVYITSGEGRFESDSQPEVAVAGGAALLLFPGEWHRYHPRAETGWTEYWVGFRGREAERILRGFFDPRHPVCRVEHPEALTQHFEQILHWLREPSLAREQILASHLPMVLAFLRPERLHTSRHADRDVERIVRAKAALLTHPDSRADLESLASDLGMSYSQFRATFKHQTGFSPRAFENRIKLNRARDLLLRRGLTVGETADALGYSSVYYFSRAFKKEFGLSPRLWLQRHR